MIKIIIIINVFLYIAIYCTYIYIYIYILKILLRVSLRNKTSWLVETSRSPHQYWTGTPRLKVNRNQKVKCNNEKRTKIILIMEWMHQTWAELRAAEFNWVLKLATILLHYTYIVNFFMRQYFEMRIFLISVMRIIVGHISMFWKSL